MLHALMRVLGELCLTAIRPHLGSSTVSVTCNNTCSTLQPQCLGSALQRLSIASASL